LPAWIPPDLVPLLELNALLWAWVWLVPTLVVRFRFLPQGIQGLALPGLVLVRGEAYTWRLLRHELTHVRQMRRWSPLGLCLAQAWNYLVRPLVILVTERRRPGMTELYFSNPREREAFAAMDGEGPLPRHWGARPAE
jgi:hypothetical protein